MMPRVATEFLLHFLIIVAGKVNNLVGTGKKIAKKINIFRYFYFFSYLYGQIFQFVE